MRSSSSGSRPLTPYLLANYIYYLAVLITFTTGSPHSVAACCRLHKVPELCVTALCYPARPPDDKSIYHIFEKPNNCAQHLQKVSHCLTDGRNHTHCCLQEAKDREENACLGICEGRVNITEPSWTKYQACLALNLPSMFSCFVRGYMSIPSQPHSVQVSIANAETVKVAWAAPVLNRHLAYQYMVVIRERDGYRKIETMANATFTMIGGLLSDTRYTAQLFSMTHDGKHRSLGSDIQMFQTPGDPPKVTAYKAEIRVSREGKSAFIACVAVTSGSPKSEPKVVWLKKNGKFYETLYKRHYKYNFTMYTGNLKQPREYVSMVEISSLTLEDSGRYRCIANNSFGSGHADMELKVNVNPIANAIPPDLPLPCCKRLGVHERCLPMCGAPLEKRKTPKKPSMPINCSVEIDKVLQCAMNYHVDDGQCCMRRGVPRACMYLCDNNDKKQSFTWHTCVEHSQSIEECRLEGEMKRPGPVPSVEAVVPSVPNEDVLIRWKEGTKAEAYHVYWKGSDNHWSVRTVTAVEGRNHSRKITPNAREVAIVSANDHGSSFPVYLSLVNGHWRKI
ncbi:hypothetical protein L596_003951 [Steinernema carpocapsae]|uniref:Ig-like domain-containing protein n=1 Tax=Steinernema carpocapsae TaxID=34508 RepID=A0A4U8UUA1_STECR|nr:hypothetical protein L596_003951 [Steinernema carpocapsae]